MTLAECVSDKHVTDGDRNLTKVAQTLRKRQISPVAMPFRFTFTLLLLGRKTSQNVEVNTGATRRTAGEARTEYLSTLRLELEFRDQPMVSPDSSESALENEAHKSLKREKSYLRTSRNGYRDRTA